jgi:hypothetical protein
MAWRHPAHPIKDYVPFSLAGRSILVLPRRLSVSIETFHRASSAASPVSITNLNVRRTITSCRDDANSLASNNGRQFGFIAELARAAPLQTR